MVTRRAVLFGGLGLPLLASATGMLAPASAAKRSTRRTGRPFVSHALYESQVMEARRFVQGFNGTDAGVYGLQGDMADFWYVQTRYGAERKRPESLKSIAGMTLPGTAFCLDIAGRDLRMTMALQIDHRRAGNGYIHHSLAGPATVIGSIVSGLTDPSHDWPAAIGTVIRALSARDLAGSSISHELVTRAALSGSIEHLTTWVLAPVRSDLRAVAS